MITRRLSILTLSSLLIFTSHAQAGFRVADSGTGGGGQILPNIFASCSASANGLRVDSEVNFQIQSTSNGGGDGFVEIGGEEGLLRVSIDTPSLTNLGNISVIIDAVASTGGDIQSVSGVGLSISNGQGASVSVNTPTLVVNCNFSSVQ